MPAVLSNRAATSDASVDFYCDEVLSGRTAVQRVMETDHVLAFHHTRPSYPVHIVVIPKRHISSFLSLDVSDHALLSGLIGLVQKVADTVTASHGCCRVITNMGSYQDSKHLHWHVISGRAGEAPAPAHG
jgi:histidine triad (HIT) family protein